MLTHSYSCTNHTQYRCEEDRNRNAKWRPIEFMRQMLEREKYKWILFKSWRLRCTRAESACVCVLRHRLWPYAAHIAFYCNNLNSALLITRQVSDNEKNKWSEQSMLLCSFAKQPSLNWNYYSWDKSYSIFTFTFKLHNRRNLLLLLPVLSR